MALFNDLNLFVHFSGLSLLFGHALKSILEEEQEEELFTFIKEQSLH